jgi:hypothetical protein
MSPSRVDPGKLVSYLSQLSPDVAAFLVREIERHRQAGEDDPSFEHILGAARQLVRIKNSSIERLTTPLRLFCAPFADLLVDDKLGVREPARISRGSIGPVWSWLTGPHGPATLIEIVAGLSRKAHDGERKAVETLQRGMIDEAASAIAGAATRAAESRRELARLSARLGGADVLDDAVAMAAALRSFDATIRLRAAIPARIVDFSPGLCHEVLAALAAFADASPEPGLGYATLLSRLAYPSEALRAAVSAISSDDAGRIAASRFARLGEILLSDCAIAAQRVDLLVRERAEPMEVLDALDRFHRLAEGFSAEVNLSPRSAWSRSLAASRAIASRALDAETRRIPQMLSTLFKPYIDDRTAKKVPEPDAKALLELQRSLRLSSDCRQFLSQLPLHEAVMRCDTQVRARLATTADILLADLRSAGAARGERVQAWFDAAVSLSRVAFGDQDAAALARSGKVAGQSAA